VPNVREPWGEPDAEAAAGLRNEALREIKPGHELHGVGLTCIALCGGCDDVVFRCEDGSFAVVHLTWHPSSD